MPRPAPASTLPALDLTARHDEQLVIERVRAGDALALEVIFTAYRAELLAAAQRVTHSRALAEEVVQDVFLAVWTGRARWHVRTSLGAYLHRAVSNAASRAAGSRTRGATTGDEIDEAARFAPARFHDPAPSPVEQAERAVFASAVSRATRDMPPRAQEVFALSRDHDLSNAEIAAALGVSTKTVESHMTRALGVLRERLGAWRGNRS